VWSHAEVAEDFRFLCAYAYNCYMIRASIAGASGYAGGELLRILSAHPGIQVGPIAAGARAGERVVDVHPALTSLADRTMVATDAATLADADIAFLALPHGESAALAAQLPERVRIVDLGADFRLHDPAAWQQYYGSPHAGTWTYGLPELPGARSSIASATRIANPGCYATSVALALAPLVGTGLIETQDIVIVAASGTSGAGRKATENLLASNVMGSMSTYKTGGTHQHTPEMEQTLSLVCGQRVRLSFTPLLAPMPRGIISTCTALAAPGTTVEDVRHALHSAYAEEAFVTVLPEGAWPQTASVSGSNAVQLQCALDSHTGRVTVVSVLDNLVKGAAGQAVQNANLMLGLPEISGLTADGVAP